MTRSIPDPKKAKPKVGRPKTTGSGEAQIVRMHKPQIEAVDAWIAAQDAEMSRPEAMRRLIELGLMASKQTVEQINEAKSHAGMAAKLASELGLKAKK